MDDSLPETPQEDQAEHYLQLLNQHEQALSVYIHTLVPDFSDAEDILQSCRLTMWKQFGKFEVGSNFVAWARKIELNQVLNYRRSRKRKPLSAVDPALIEAIANEIDSQGKQLDARSEALETCLGRLPENQRQTILLRYYEGFGIDEIARQTDRTESAVYRLLSRIRAALNECVTDQLNLSRT